MTDPAKSPMRPSLQFLIFLICGLVAILAGNVVADAIVAIFYGTNALGDLMSIKSASPEAVNALWILQIVGTTLPIFAAPVFFSYAVVRQPRTYLKWNRPFPWQLIFISLVLMFFSLPVMEQLSNINQRLALPHFLKGVEDWMRNSEKQVEKLTALMLTMNSIWDMLKALVLIAGVTAVVEELMFRGVLQTIFLKWTKNHHAAIWITAAIFSAFHMEFFGFLPRLMLGVFFGYFVYWSGSIWTSVWAHFINNGLAVIATYMYQHKAITVDPDSTHNFNLTGYILSIMVVASLLFSYRNTAVAAKKVAEEQDGE